MQFFGRAPALSAEQKLEQDVDRVLDEVAEGMHNVRWDVLRSLRAGEKLLQTGGSGIEFRQLRSFVQGQDEIKMLHARQTAKRGGEHGDWVVRENRPEVISIDYLLMDVAPTHDFGNLRESKLWLCARAGATAALSTEAAGDLLGFVAYADNEIVRHIQPRSPRRILRDIIGNIIEPPYASGDVASGLEDAFSKLPRQRTSVVWITDCLNLTDKQKDLVAEAAGRHRLLAVVPQDLREWKLPEPRWWWPFPYRLKVFDLTTHRRYSFYCNKRNRDLYTQEFQRHTEELVRFFDQVGVRHAIVHTEHEVEVRDYNTQAELEKAITEHRMEQVLKVQQLIWMP
jgi:uncharacterized protein (DUF58 family)